MRHENNFSRQGGMGWIGVYAFYLTLSFDYKSLESTGGTPLHAISMLSCIIIGTHQIATSANRLKLRSRMGLMGLGFVCYCTFMVVNSILRGVPLAEYSRDVLPYAFAAFGFMVTGSYIINGVGLYGIVRALLAACFCNSLWNILYCLAIAGYPIDVVRYQLLGSGLPFIIAFGLSSLYINRKLSRAMIVSCVYPIIPLGLSITKSFLFSYIILLLCTAIISLRRKRFGIIGSRISLLVFGILLTSFIILTVRENAFDKWSYRLSQLSISGEGLKSPTLLTREAERSGQWNQLSANWINMFFGMGIGNAYYWDSDYYSELLSYGIPEYKIIGPKNYHGHSIWMFSLYSGGLLFGWFVPGLLIWGLLRSWRRLLSNDSYYLDNHVTLTMAYYFLYQAFCGTVQNLFIYRFGGFVFGACVAVAMLHKEGKDDD